MSNTFLDQTKGQLIVSCQALPEEPLYSSFIMARMARAVKQAGAIALRANSVVDIQAIQDETGLPIIGINKHIFTNAESYITPTLQDMRAVAATGVPVVAVEVTGRTRPNGENLKDQVTAFRSEYPDTLLMADTDTLVNVRAADALGFDLIGTTMHGYTDASKGANIADDDFAYLKQVLSATDRPVIAEGKIDTPEKLRRCIDLGAHAVVVGGAITRPLEIAGRFLAAVK